jgi:hypothetical protein
LEWQRADGLADGLEVAIQLRCEIAAVRRMSLTVLMTLLAVVVVASCALRLGDPGYSVTTKNGADVPLTVFVDDVGAKPGTLAVDGVRLEPGADFVAHWVVPSGPQDARRAKVRANASSGGMYYCHQFTFDEMKNLRFHILLGPGVNDCN